MRPAAVIAFLVLASAARAHADTCLDCHSSLEDQLGLPARLIQTDIHKKNGFSCADCHGGDPTSTDMAIAMSRSKGFLGKIGRRSIPELCARCHADAALIHKFRPQQRVDQFALYRTSVHGKRLVAGDTRVATCIDCHSVHDIREVRDTLSPVHPLRLPDTCARCHADAAYMKSYGIPTNQFEQYRRSVHWQALAERGDISAPSCASCHGNHGAAPPGVASVENVCGSCHVIFQTLFDESPHKAGFENMGVASCVTCHNNHEIVEPGPGMLGVDRTAVCVKCHIEGDPGYAAAATMSREIDGLRSAIAGAEAVLKQAETSGMEVSEGKLQLAAAQEEWIKARVQVHAFRTEAVKAPVSQGLEIAFKGRQTGIEALRERNVRRVGLGASLIAIAITLAGLWLALRGLERRQTQSQEFRKFGP